MMYVYLRGFGAAVFDGVPHEVLKYLGQFSRGIKILSYISPSRCSLYK
jgi:hypothetical protein